MPIITERGLAGEPDGPFDIVLQAGETRVPAGASWHVLRPEGMRGWIIQLTTAGRGRVRAGEAELLVDPGDALLFAPAAVHDYDRDPAGPAWHHRWAYFRPRAHWLPWLAWPDAGGHVGRQRLGREAAAGLAARLAAAEQAVRSRSPLGQDLAMCRLEEALIGLAAQRAAPEWDPLVAQARSFIEELHQLPLSVAEVAARVGLSPSRLAHRFRAATGLGIIAWRDECRMQRACQLLRTTGMPVAEVARTVGYADPLFFARAFRRRTNASPSEYRAAYDRSVLPAAPGSSRTSRGSR
jgi:AraC family transcriptional regulator of arabinose operon